MVVSFQIEQKSFGNKQLYSKVDASIGDNEKIGLIEFHGEQHFKEVPYFQNK